MALTTYIEMRPSAGGDMEWPLSAASEQWRTPPVSARLPGCLRSPGIDVSPKRIGGRACPTPSPPRSPFRPFERPVAAHSLGICHCVAARADVRRDRREGRKVRERDVVIGKPAARGAEKGADDEVAQRRRTVHQPLGLRGHRRRRHCVPSWNRPCDGDRLRRPQGSGRRFLGVSVDF